MAPLSPEQIGDLASRLAASLFHGLDRGEVSHTININLTVRVELPDSGKQAGELLRSIMEAPARPGRGNGIEHLPIGSSSEPADGPADPRLHVVSSPPAAGGGEGDEDPCARLRAYVEGTQCSLHHVERHAQISWATVRKVLQGESVSLETQRKIQAFLDTAPAEPPAEPQPRPATESAATTPEPPQAANPGHDWPEPPDGGGGAGTPANDLCQQLRDYLWREDVSIAETARRLGFREQSVRDWMMGKTIPSRASQGAIQALLNGSAAAEPKFEPNDDPETIGNLPTVPTPQQAAAYLQKTLAAWMRSERLSHERAAEEIGIRKQLLVQILQVKLPMEDVLRLIAARLPELKPDLPKLLQARRQVDRVPAA